MIRNWYSALTWRRARALGVLLLGFWAGVLAAAGPAFLAAGEQMAVDGIVASRTDREEHQLLIEAELGQDKRPLNRDFRLAGLEMRLPGFDTVFERSISSTPANRKGIGSSSLGYRSGVCAHLAVRGRCPGGTGEILVEERFAADHGWTIGSTVLWTQAQLLPNPERPPIPRQIAVPTGDPVTLMVVGIYTPLSPQETYWGGTVFRYDSLNYPPTFTTIQTLDMYQLEVAERQSYLLVSTMDAFETGRLGKLDAEIAALDSRTQALKGRTTNRMGSLIEAAKAERERLRQLVASGTAVLGALVIVLGYLLAATDAAQKGQEHGVMRMRGVPAAARWGMIMAMPLAPMLSGFAAGAVLAPLALPLAWPLLLPGASIPPLGALTFSFTTVLMVGGGLALAMVAGFAVRLRASTLDLLRGTRTFSRRRLAVLLEIVAVVLAGVMLVQLRSQQTGSASQAAGSLIGLLAPAFLILVGAILMSRIGVPLARWAGRSALRRGRVATALAALQVARGTLYRPLLVTLTAGVAAVLFALATVDIGQTAGERESELTVGAERVLTVAAVDPGHVISALEAIDPQGRFSMAAATAPGIVAVDVGRLRSVASWPAGVGDPDGVVRELRPNGVAPVRFLTRAVVVTVVADAAARLRLTVVPTGTSSWSTPEVEVQPGRHDYEVPASLCLSGCRLASLSIAGKGSFTISKIQPLTGAAVPLDIFADPGRWRVNGGTPSFGEGALSLRGNGPSLTAYLDPVTAALPLVATRNFVSPTITMGASIISVHGVGQEDVVPRLLTDGVMVDLDYLDLVTDGDAGLSAFEVWLNRSAPADMEKLLRDKGLVVTSERRLADARSTAERRAPALASRIAAAGAGLACLACALGMALVGGLERRRQGELIDALAAQGLRRRPRRRLTWLGYGIVGGLALILGPVLAAVMFVVLEPGRRLAVPLKLIPETPSPVVVGVTWLAAAVAVMCAPAALALRERMKR